MKFEQLPKEMQKGLLRGTRKTLVISTIILCMFFLGIAALIAAIGYNMWVIALFPTLVAVVGVINLFMELKSPSNCLDNSIKSSDYSFSPSSASQSDEEVDDPPKIAGRYTALHPQRFYFFMRSSASRTNTIPTAMLRKIYNAAIPECPFFKRFELSRANVENVVKPPQIPTFKNNTRRGFRLLDFKLRAAINPMTKHPSTLIAKVFIGNRVCSLRGINPIK